MKLTTEQKAIYAINTRFCVESTTQSIEAMERFIDICREIYQKIFFKQTRILGCFSFELIPYVLADDADEKYIVMDTHFMDYYMDYVYVLEKNNKDVFKAFFYKYLSEIECNKGNMAASAMYFAQYKNEKQLLSYDIKNKMPLAVNAGLFTFLHEAVHTDSDSDICQSYLAVYHANAAKDLKKFEITRSIEQAEILKEGQSDFIAVSMMLLTDLFTSSFKISKQELYNTCLTAISAHFFYKILKEIIIEQIDKEKLNIDKITNSLFCRIINLAVYSLGMGREDFIFHDIERKQILRKVIDPYVQMIKWIAELLQYDIINCVSDFSNLIDQDKIIKDHVSKIEKLRENAWVYV